MNNTVEDFKHQHLENYKKAVFELLKNNSTVLVEEDIMLLLKKPPLDSMDSIKVKFLDLAKKQKIILDIEQLDQLLLDFREGASKIGDSLKDIRISHLEKIIKDFNPQKETEIIKFNKKDFTMLNKKMKTVIKEQVKNSLDENIVKNVKSIFTENTDIEKKEKVEEDILKFLNKNYLKQLLESVDFKILVKDTILINAVKEQGERYLFTKMNSYLLNDKKQSIKK